MMTARRVYFVSKETDQKSMLVVILDIVNAGQGCTGQTACDLTDVEQVAHVEREGCLPIPIDEK
jgi:hypothetical protein